MSTTQHTGHYNLPTFGDNPNDRPSWRGDFTDAMTKIDNQMYANATNITTATAAANNAKTAADAAKESADNAAELAQANKTDIAELDGYFSKLGVTSAQTAQNLMDTINGKAEDTDLTALQSTVSSLSNRVDGKADSSNVYTKGQADTTFTKQGGYSGTAQQLNASISQNTSGLAALLESLKPVQILNKNFDFHGIGAGNSGRANVRAFAIPGIRLCLARILIWSDDVPSVTPKWPGMPNFGAKQPLTSTVTATPVVAASIPQQYRPTIPFRVIQEVKVYGSTPTYSLGFEVWPNGNVEVYRNSGQDVTAGNHITTPGVNLVWTYSV